MCRPYPDSLLGPVFDRPVLVFVFFRIQVRIVRVEFVVLWSTLPNSACIREPPIEFLARRVDSRLSGFHGIFSTGANVREAIARGLETLLDSSFRHLISVFDVALQIICGSLRSCPQPTSPGPQDLSGFFPTARSHQKGDPRTAQRTPKKRPETAAGTLYNHDWPVVFV
jgi:hypothetical protein